MRAQYQYPSENFVLTTFGLLNPFADLIYL
jgi:hypothetical protein